MSRPCVSSICFSALFRSLISSLSRVFAAAYADRILVIATPDPASLRDAAEAADQLARMGKENVRLIVNRVGGKTHEEEISLDYTVEPKRKLEKWAAYEVEWFRPTITQWPHGYVNTLEVELRE